jgi:hypothetical protein
LTSLARPPTRELAIVGGLSLKISDVDLIFYAKEHDHLDGELELGWDPECLPLSTVLPSVLPILELISGQAESQCLVPLSAAVNCDK